MNKKEFWEQLTPAIDFVTRRLQVYLLNHRDIENSRVDDLVQELLLYAYSSDRFDEQAIKKGNRAAEYFQIKYCSIETYASDKLEWKLSKVIESSPFLKQFTIDLFRFTRHWIKKRYIDILKKHDVIHDLSASEKREEIFKTENILKNGERYKERKYTQFLTDKNVEDFTELNIEFEVEPDTEIVELFNEPSTEIKRVVKTILNCIETALLKEKNENKRIFLHKVLWLQHDMTMPQLASTCGIVENQANVIFKRFKDRLEKEILARGVDIIIVDATMDGISPKNKGFVENISSGLVG
jgi:hypothetical protein